MNAIGMDMPVTQVLRGEPSIKESNKSNVSSFKHMLTGKQQGEANFQPKQSQNADEIEADALSEEIRQTISEGNIGALYELVMQAENEIDIQALLKGNSEMLSVDLNTENGNLLADLEKNLALLSGNTDSIKSMEVLELLTAQQVEGAKMTIPLNEPEAVDITKLKKTLVDIVSQFETLLAQINKKEDIPKVAPKIIELLQQWTKIEKKAGNSNIVADLIRSVTDEQSKEKLVWKDLVQFFQKRDQMSLKQQYNMDAKVTNNDVQRWLNKAMENHGLTEKASLNLHTGTTISKLEQYVIHINQNQGLQPANQQLLEKFQSIMKSSKFLALPNGTNQLSISLQPNNLGEIRARFTQINGEMTVKIIVTTQAAKEMLEANIKQLKNMFSPQQVVIEKQEVNTQPTQNTQKEQNAEQWNEDNSGEHSNHSEQQQNQNPDEDFESQFRELLMNEKV